jgi:hypothetical protein
MEIIGKNPVSVNVYFIACRPLKSLNLLLISTSAYTLYGPAAIIDAGVKSQQQPD